MFSPFLRNANTGKRVVSGLNPLEINIFKINPDNFLLNIEQTYSDFCYYEHKVVPAKNY